ncbi:MAG: hypothetical protein WA447_14400 [Candidatus Binatus sp.]
MNFSKPLLNLPLAGGVNVTETGQLPAGGIALIHPFDLRLKPVPVTVTRGVDSSTLPLLVSVMFWGVL